MRTASRPLSLLMAGLALAGCFSSPPDPTDPVEVQVCVLSDTDPEDASGVCLEN